MGGYQRRMVYNRDMEDLINSGEMKTNELKDLVVNLSRVIRDGKCCAEVQTLVGLLKVIDPTNLKVVITEVNKMLIDKQSELIRVPIVPNKLDRSTPLDKPTEISGAVVSTPVKLPESSGNSKEDKPRPNALGC